VFVLVRIQSCGYDHFWLSGSFCDPETDIARGLQWGMFLLPEAATGSTRHEVRGNPALSRRLQLFRVLHDAP
jgi:hypothetical protein